MATKATRTTPAKATASSDAPEPAAETTAKATKATPAKAVRPESAAAETPDDGEGAVEQAPLNRAERRAKGRGKTAAQVPGGRGKVSGGHGPAHTQRNWASRRSG